MTNGTPSTTERFFAKVNKTDTCWLWTAALCTPGYGHFRVGQRTVMAHRLSYEMARGPIPKGLVIDHLCRVLTCVNPAHLEAVPQRVNNLRGSSPSARNTVKTHCIHGHEFTPANTYRPTRGGRACRECARRRRRAKSSSRSV